MLKGWKHGWTVQRGHGLRGFTLEAVYPTWQPALLPPRCTAETSSLSYSFTFIYLF